VSVTTHSVRALGTTATVCVTHRDDLSSARAELETGLAEVDEICSRFRSDSELAHLNAAAGRPVAVSTRLLEEIEVALAAALVSGGLVDPTVGHTLRLAGYDQTFALVRGRDGRSFRPRFASVPGWRQIEVDAARSTVHLPAGCELDLGATAKALAADRIVRNAVSSSHGGVLISIGGDIAVSGEPPPGGWPVRLADDHAAGLGSRGPVVAIRSGGLATSSTTVRRWRAGRLELHHIVDPRTGRPADTPWRTISAATGSCLDANVATTAAMVLGEEAPEWLSRSRLPARLVRTNGDVVCVAGWPDETESP